METRSLEIKSDWRYRGGVLKRRSRKMFEKLYKRPLEAPQRKVTKSALPTLSDAFDLAGAANGRFGEAALQRLTTCPRSGPAVLNDA